MHRKNYDQKIITQFDIVGSFFIDTFYNDLYLKSKDAFSRGKSQSLTDSYRNYITQYVKTIGVVTEAYMKVVKNLHEYYQAKMSYPSTLSEFVDSMVSKFMPPTYYRDFTPINKDRALHEIIIKTTNRLGTSMCSKDMLHRIIDDHRNPANVSMLQDMILDIFLMQREEYYSKFADQIASENDKIPVDIYNKMKSALCAETKKRTDCEIERDKLIGIVNKLLAKCNELSEQADSLQSLQSVQTMQSTHDIQLEDAERKLQELERKIRESERELRESERKQNQVDNNIRSSEHTLRELERKRADIEASIGKLERDLEVRQKQVEDSTVQVIAQPNDMLQLIEFTVNENKKVPVNTSASDDGTTYDPWA